MRAFFSASSSRFVPIRSNTSFLALCVEGEKIVEICQKGDQLLDEEIAKVYKGKKIAKGKPCCLGTGMSQICQC